MSKVGWSSYNPHYSSLLLYQDKYGTTDRPLGTQQSPYQASSGEKTYGVKGQSYQSYKPTHKSYLHDGGGGGRDGDGSADEVVSARKSHAALYDNHRPLYASTSTWDLSTRRHRPHVSTYSWEVQRAMVQTELPYSRSVRAIKLGGGDEVKPAQPAQQTCTKCSKCTCSRCGCGGGGHAGPAGDSHPHQRAAVQLNTAPTHFTFSGSGRKSGYQHLIDRDDDYGDSAKGLHRRFPSTKIGSTAYSGYSSFNRPTRRFTVAGIYY